MSSLKVTINGEKVELDGYLDEKSDLTVLKELNGDIIVDFKNLTRINSCGVKEWVEVINTGDKNLSYDNCSLVTVKQLNAVPDFMGGSRVIKFYAPYYCEECDEERECLLEVANFDPGNVPELKCSECEHAMSFDGVASHYFSFLKRD